jgi:hypothetical protein
MRRDGMRQPCHPCRSCDAPRPWWGRCAAQSPKPLSPSSQQPPERREAWRGGNRCSRLALDATVTAPTPYRISSKGGGTVWGLSGAQCRELTGKRVSPPVLISRHCAGTIPITVPPLCPEIDMGVGYPYPETTRARAKADTPTGRRMWGTVWGKSAGARKTAYFSTP